MQKIPDREEILRVFSVIVFIVYTWMGFVLLWRLPGWLKFLRIEEILSTIYHTLPYLLFESGVVLGFLVLLCLILPAKYYRNQFVSQSFIFLVLLSIWAFTFQMRFLFFVLFPVSLKLLWLSLVFITIFMAWLIIYRSSKLRLVVDRVAGRMIVFLYLYIPLTLISFILVFLT